ncbi:MAG TPA: hypothetical protein VF944_10880 [Candidatus Bathyarchaeia archaeon]
MSATEYWKKMTPEERSAEMKRRMGKRSRGVKKSAAKVKAANKSTRVKEHKDDGREENSNHIAYLFGKVETIIEHYASSAGVPRAALASGVGRLLQGKEVW